MKRVKRILAFLSVIALAFSILVGCSNTEKTSGKKTVTFWIFKNPPMEQETKKLIKEYEKENKNIHIDLQVMPNDQYFEKYLVALGTQTGPDVLLTSDRSIPALAEKKVLAPVKTKAFGYDNLDAMKSDWLNGSLDGLTYKDNVYGIPMEFDTFSLYINKKAFADAGLDPVKDAPKTWEDLENVAQKLTIRKDGKLVQAGFAWPMFSGGYDALIMDPMVRQLGGSFIEDYGKTANFESPEVKKVYQTYVDMYNKYKVDEIGFGAAEAASPMQDFADGKVAMWICGPWAVPLITKDSKAYDQYAVVPLPQFNPDKPVSLLYSWNWSVNSAAKNPDEAWKFVNFLSQHQKEWLSVAGYIQPRKGWLDDPDAKSFPFMDVWQKDMTNGHYILRSKSYDQLVDVIGRSVDAVMKDNKPIDEALKSAQQEAEKILKEDN